MKRIVLLIAILLVPVITQAKPKPETGLHVHVFAQTGSACGTGIAHCTVITWTISSSAAGCTGSCTFGYNVFRGMTSGGESTTPVNLGQIPGTTYIDPITLTNSPQTFYYTVEAVETSGGVAASSGPSNEVSDTFPATPSAPTASSATAH